jgi:hypothetical protein
VALDIEYCAYDPTSRSLTAAAASGTTISTLRWRIVDASEVIAARYFARLYETGGEERTYAVTQTSCDC